MHLQSNMLRFCVHKFKRTRSSQQCFIQFIAKIARNLKIDSLITQQNYKVSNVLEHYSSMGSTSESQV